MRYEGRIFRPPSEASSLLVQVTVGCSHNKCTFCSMYHEKKFSVRDMEEVKEDLEGFAKRHAGVVRRVFLCDGNALVLPMDSLRMVLGLIRRLFPNCERVSSYAQPLDILRKSTEELAELYALGLKLVYVGLESGSDKVLTMVNKGVTRDQMIKAADVLRPSGIKSSIMVITGLGGQELWQDHAKETSSALNLIQPDYLGLLALMVEPGAQIFDDVRDGRFRLLTAGQVVLEMYEMISGLELTNCMFSSIHASNYINLRGNLPSDKDRIMKELDYYRQNEDSYKDENRRQL